MYSSFTLCHTLIRLTFVFLLKTWHRKSIDHCINQWKSKYVERISSTLIDKFHRKHILFHVFSQTVDNQKEKEIKKLKSEKPKEGREKTLLWELGFDPGACSGKKKLKSKKQTTTGKQLFCQNQVLILGSVRPVNFYEF